MRRENKIFRRQAAVFGDFGRVPMGEESIGAKIFIHFDKVGFALGFLACAADSGFAIADDSAGGIDPACFDQGPQTENHGGGIAAGIGDQARRGERVGVKFGQAVNRLGERCRIRRGKLVPVRERFRSAETIGAAEVHDARSRIRGKQRGHQFERRLVRRRKKDHLGAARGDGFQGKRFAGGFAPSAQLWIQLREAADFGMAFAEIKDWLFDFWVPKEEAGQLESCVARCSDDGDPQGVVHRSISSTRFWIAPRAVRDGVMMRTVSSPARVPATSLQCSESTAAARGCAPPGGVLSTSIFCAGRISSKNSFRARARAGTGEDSSALAAASGLYPSAVFTRRSSRRSRESVACVTRTPRCTSCRRNSSWLATGGPASTFKICPCRNLLCAPIDNLMRDYSSLCIIIHYGPVVSTVQTKKLRKQVPPELRSWNRDAREKNAEIIPTAGIQSPSKS